MEDALRAGERGRHEDAADPVPVAGQRLLPVQTPGPGPHGQKRQLSGGRQTPACV